MSGICVVRGGGDLATGVIWRLHRCGIRVVVTELEQPLAIRRTVAFSSAVTEGSISIEGLDAVRVDDAAGALHAGTHNRIPVLVDPELSVLSVLADVTTVVDARLAKSAGDTSMSLAPLVIALGPGFTAGDHCHAVVETNRGHRLGRVIWSGAAEPNTGRPAPIDGHADDRVIRAHHRGTIVWHYSIGDLVHGGDVLGIITRGDTNDAVVAPFTGVLRGAIAPGTTVHEGLKIADVDPRCDPSACYTISDKALAIGGGVVEAVLARRAP